MDVFVEQRVRRVVAEVLGVEPALITAGVSLSDDLAADSLDAIELCGALEDEFGVPLARGLPGWVRTFGQLVAYVDEARPLSPPLLVATVIPRSESWPPPLVRSEWLTPYAIESIVEDAKRYGPGTTLDVAVDRADERSLVELRAAFARLEARDICVRVHGPGDAKSHPNAA